MAMEIVVFFLLALTGITPSTGGNPPSARGNPPSSADPPAPPKTPQIDACDGIYVEYRVDSVKRVYPFVDDPKTQGYAFNATLQVLNTGDLELKKWRVFVGFQHQEVLVFVSGAVLTDGTALPAEVGKGTMFTGYPVTDLKTAIETAGDLNQIEVNVTLVGTEFGVKPPSLPLPSTIRLVHDNYTCPEAKTIDKGPMYVCCVYDGKSRYNVTEGAKIYPRQHGDLTIDYDIIQSYKTSYLAKVTINNTNPLARLDNWKLSWEWMRDEFIFGMKGAYTLLTDSSECVTGPQGAFYKDFDFAKVMNCQRKPAIVDLSPYRYNDTDVGRIPYCCRNGTLLPYVMDPDKSKSVFLVQVFKMPPDLDPTVFASPQNFKINGSEHNREYQCGPPIRVSPSVYPDPSGLQSSSAAIASWQVVCNITQVKKSPRCCVSFSAFWNESVIPCKPCSCGCPARSTCSPTVPPLLLPPDAFLYPFVNRTKKTLEWADINHFNVPDPLPCGDNCGVSINWHIYTDYLNGWSARVTLLNWETFSFPDWYVAVQMDKASPGYEGMISLNGTLVPGLNNTIFMQGLSNQSYLLAEDVTPTPQNDPPRPGKQQTVITFTKGATPGIKLPDGDGFPNMVIFNGEECPLPTIHPNVENSAMAAPKSILSFILIVVVAFMLEDQLWC